MLVEVFEQLQKKKTIPHILKTKNPTFQWDFIFMNTFSFSIPEFFHLPDIHQK